MILKIINTPRKIHQSLLVAGYVVGPEIRQILVAIPTAEQVDGLPRPVHHQLMPASWRRFTGNIQISLKGSFH